MSKKWFIVFVSLLCVTLIDARGKRPLMPEDLGKIKQVSDPRVSPDGKWIAYTVSVPDLEADGADSDIWLIPSSGGKALRLTAGAGSDHSPRWSPEGKRIAFISDRDGTGNIYLIRINGGEAQKITSSDTALFSPLWSKDGKYMICCSRVLPVGKKNLENRTKDQPDKCKARTIDRLLFRQWNRWLGDKRNHLFLVNMETGSMKALTPGDADVPPVSLSSGSEFDISPDGKEVCFVRNDDPMLAISTNHDIFALDIAALSEKKITVNPALDTQPVYSPDGRYIAYAAMKKVGYESDRKCLVLYDRKSKRHLRLTDSLDRSVGEILWGPGSRIIYFTARDQGRSSIFKVNLRGEVQRITNVGYNTHIAITPDGKRLVFLRSFNHLPREVFTLRLKNGETQQLTFTNARFLAELDLPVLEDFWFTGAEGTGVHGFLLKPPGFDPQKKYPVILTIHGGPQNMWADRFMITWFTFQLISSPGYVGVFINPRGSSGYGSTFREQVSKDYGGRCFQDLVKGLDYVIKNFDFIDGGRQGAIGGSFGGYSVNWLMGHTDRFKCIVSHAGLYNLVSFYGSTEELWYPAWDMGETPWDEPELYARWSPHLHAKNFKTPTLVTHGLKDFRVPLSESLQLFTALRRQNVPSRFVYFPDEGHVIGGYQNNVRWWKEIHRWFTQYLR